MYRYRMLFVFLLLFPGTPLVAAEGALQACFECHGADGMGKADPMIPVIAPIGVDTDGNGSVNAYVPNPTAAQLQEIAAIRIYVLARSVRGDPSYVNPSDASSCRHSSSC